MSGLADRIEERAMKKGLAQGVAQGVAQGEFETTIKFLIKKIKSGLSIFDALIDLGIDENDHPKYLEALCKRGYN